MPEVNEKPIGDRLPAWVWPLVLVLVVLVFYGRTLGFAFTNWDDDPLLTANPLLIPWSWRALAALFRPAAIPQEQLYIPLTYLTHWLEVSFLGHPGSSLTHGVNVMLHAVNVLLVFRFLKRLGLMLSAAWIGALVFALHPLQVEAVAWAMGRKDLLSTSFAILALLAWWHWRRHMRWRHYAAALVLYVAAMLAKPSLIVLPAIFVLLDSYQKAPLCQRTVLEKIPLGALGVTVFLLQPGTIRTVSERVPMGYRVACLPWVVKDWLLRLAVVEQPCAFHPWPEQPAWLLLVVGLPVLFVLGTSLWLAVWFHKTPLWFGLAFVLSAALPAFSVILTYRKFVTADRYLYFPLVGVVFLLAMVADTWRRQLHPVLLAGFCVWLAWAAGSTWQRIGEWRNSQTLWTATTERAPSAHHAWLNLGVTREESGELDAAVDAYKQAVALKPRFASGWRHLAGALLQLEEFEAAVNAAKKAERLLSPVRDAAERAKALQTLGAANYRSGDYAEAIKAYTEQESLLGPTAANQLALGLSLARLERYSEAIPRFRKVLDLDPQVGEAYAGLALCLNKTERPEAAREIFKQLQRKNPKSPFLPSEFQPNAVD